MPACCPRSHATVAEIARIIWEACEKDASTFGLAHLSTFPVDVQRRWPSVEKARKLLGWEARIEVEDGIAATVRWLREREPPAASGRTARKSSASARG